MRAPFFRVLAPCFTRLKPKKSLIFQLFLKVLTFFPIMKEMSKNLLTFLIFFLLTSCERPGIEDVRTKSITQASDFETSQPFNPYCNLEEKTNICITSSECINFCEFFYSKSPDKNRFCKSWPLSFYQRFEKLFSQIYNLDTAHLNAEDMACFIDLNKDNKALFVRDLNQDQASFFLKKVAEDEVFAKKIASKDSDRDFSILKLLFKKTTGSTKPTAFAPDLPLIGESFFDLIDKHSNRSAWGWLDSFLNQACSEKRTCDNSLEFYCQFFKETSYANAINFLDNQFFENKYGNFIKSQSFCNRGCEYGDLGDLKKVCNKL